MRRSFNVVVSATSVLFVFSTAGAVAAVDDPSTKPVVLAPVAGAQLVGDFNGPVLVDFSPVQVGEDYYVSARLEGDCDEVATVHPCAAETTVPVTADTGQVEVNLGRSLERDGRYRLEVGAVTGGLVTTSTFTLTGTSGGVPAPPTATVVEPSGHVSAGFAGPVVVRFGQTDYPHEYSVRLRDSSRATLWSTTVTTRGGTQDWFVPKLREPGRYHVVVTDVDRGAVHADKVFAVDPPPLRLSEVAASRVGFFPRVRDGYRDSVTVEYRQSDTAAVQWSVRNAAGRRVRTVGGVREDAGRHRLTWNGRDDAGRLVPVGAYRIKLRGLTQDGRKDVARIDVRVKSKKVWHRNTTKSRNGQQWSDRSKGGNCYFLGYSGELTLDCWGGRFAEAKYGFDVPATATNITWRIRGDVNCCDTGRLTRTGVRASDRRVVLKVRVTNWRSYTVRRADIEYDWFTRL